MQKQDNNAALRNLSALVDFSNLVNSSLDLNFALNNILLTCFGKFHTTKGIIALTNDEGLLEPKSAKGIPQSIIQNFPVVQIEELDNNRLLKEFIVKNNFVLKKTISSSGGVAGLLLLGARLTGKPYEKEDMDFLNTVLNIGVIAIENSLTVEKLKKVNRTLDSKVNQLNSLFDLGKEFSGILNVETISKLLVYSLIGQMLVSKYAVVTCSNNNITILENRFDEKSINSYLRECSANIFTKPIGYNEVELNHKPLLDIGVELIVPMQIKNETKGLILLGKRNNKLPYSKSDIEFVSSVGSLAIISIENARLFKETLEKQRLEKDLEIARNIQQNLLPKNIPELSNIEVAAYNSSARMVGGDYFDIVKLDNENLLVAVADVSGKGVPASLLMANLQAFLKSIYKQKLPLSDATNLLNDLVAENTTLGSFITFFWGIFNNISKEFTYVNAGHNPPLYVKNGSIKKLKKGGIILGVLPTNIPYLSETVKLEQNDVIVLFTDGITEAMNKNFEEYSDEQLEKLIKEVYIDTASQILEKIKLSVDEFTYGAEQSDDITCLVIKVK